MSENEEIEQTPKKNSEKSLLKYQRNSRQIFGVNHKERLEKRLEKIREDKR